MDVPVAAQFDIVLFEQIQDLRAFVFLIDRRIMQENKLFPVPRRVQRGLQPADFTQHDFSVMRVTGLFLIKPAARAAEGCVTITIAVVKNVTTATITPLHSTSTPVPRPI